MILTHIHTKKVKFYLVFFCALWLLGCAQSTENSTYNLQFNDGKATAIAFNLDETTGYAVFVKGNTETPVLGTFRKENEQYLFEPIIPFAGGQAYELKKGGKTILDFKIPQNTYKAPEVLAIYPSSDTVPENLLKMYFVFSQPMQEVGNMLDYIKVYNKTDSKAAEVFLSLENELWNTTHTQLTLWLDPGRIKKDLIPNKEKGLPIIAGKEYEITILASLKDAEGVPLVESVRKTLYVTARDIKRVNVKDWELSIPKAGSTAPLTINFTESLDAILTSETLSVYTMQGKLVPGDFKTNNKEQKVLFTPTTGWTKGSYKVVVDEYLEDLAGNNLQRLFDTNISQVSGGDTAVDNTLEFRVE